MATSQLDLFRLSLPLSFAHKPILRFPHPCWLASISSRYVCCSVLRLSSVCVCLMCGWSVCPLFSVVGVRPLLLPGRKRKILGKLGTNAHVAQPSLLRTPRNGVTNCALYRACFRSRQVSIGTLQNLFWPERRPKQS